MKVYLIKAERNGEVADIVEVQDGLSADATLKLWLHKSGLTQRSAQFYRVEEWAVKTAYSLLASYVPCSTMDEVRAGNLTHTE